MFGRAAPFAQRAERAVKVAGILEGLYLLFPENPELRADWVRRANAELGFRTPLQVIQDSEDGLFQVANLILRHLLQ